MQRPKVSVIVPVYNAEKFISRCITSILEQTIKEIEIIVVNDGSTDQSAEIINSFESLDHRIIHISQPNQGVSTARNAGLRCASGEFIGFVDADDWIEPNMFETLYALSIQHSADLVICNAFSINKNGDDNETEAGNYGRAEERS